MPFDWRDFLLFAHELRNESLESKRRTSIRRAYYYIYNVALVEAKKLGYPSANFHMKANCGVDANRTQTPTSWHWAIPGARCTRGESALTTNSRAQLHCNRTFRSSYGKPGNSS